MIHYHGLPIWPATAAAAAVSAGHAFVSAERPEQLGLAVECCQSFAVDNGAFSSWKRGEPRTDWSEFYAWAGRCQRIPSCDFAVIPDVIDGTEADNDSLIEEWPLPRWFGAPVWHMHESLDRLERLAADWGRVCLGSSGDFAVVGTSAWWQRMAAAMDVVCDADGRPGVRLHGLRMLNAAVFTRLPLASADSTNIAQNVPIDQAWRGTYTPPNKDARASILRARIESNNAPERWKKPEISKQYDLLAGLIEPTACASSYGLCDKGSGV